MSTNSFQSLGRRFVGVFAFAGAALLVWPMQVSAQNANRCVSTSQQGSKLVFSNSCNSHVYVLWCGALKYSRDRCGDGPKGSYYTHSANLEPGRTHFTNVSGRIDFAACQGRIGFGNDRNFEDLGGGQVRCLRR